MNAAKIIEAVRNAGLELRVAANGNLRLIGSPSVIAHWAPLVRETKLQILNVLGAGGEQECAIQDNYEERASRLECELCIPRTWAEHMARTLIGGTPGDFSAVRWLDAVDGAMLFLASWGTEAFRLGWPVDEVLGLHPEKPAARIDCRGLAWLLGDGSQVVRLDADGAEIVTPGGGRQRFYRPSRRGL